MLAIDHIVIASVDAKKTAESFSQLNNVKNIQGGSHVNWGTYNYLSYFENNSYLEWLSVYDESIARQADNPLIQHLTYKLAHGKEGLIQFALRTKDMDGLIRHFEKNGINYSGPFEGNRKRPDGTTLSWRMLFPAFDYKSEELLPFIIEWGGQGNVPSDSSLINNKQINTVKLIVPNPTKMINLFLKVYQLKTNSNEYQLENGFLIIQQGNKLEITVETRTV
ncbi:hypothetical protein GH741_13350 [Aquibacillus halophilus]|uniref:Glyoxalase-like domain-containing protein n=1 Tax=Aquibacillus halophilus TaxID=930132 RepID=A0A6A8DDA4_9BACI|nr:VOC family protein [Aquibacillus halophilus]MRH43658.1 hypothetical protein [Aquibacillus halophilus]